MAGEAEAARMCQPVAVADDQLRLELQPGQRLKYRRQLPEGQQPGTVGVGHPPAGNGPLHDGVAARVHHHRRGGEPVARVVVRHVDASHQAARLAWDRRGVHHLDQFPQP